MHCQAAKQMLRLYDVVYDNDVTMLEINPMVEAQDADGKKRGESNFYGVLIFVIFIVHSIVMKLYHP